jgi:hypothetical protein
MILPPVVSPSTILLRVCAWCTSRAELDRLNRAYPAQISHGLCVACAAQLAAEAA